MQLLTHITAKLRTRNGNCMLDDKFTALIPTKKLQKKLKINQLRYRQNSEPIIENNRWI